MLTEGEILVCQLGEECAEVAQRVSKALRFGIEQIQPGQHLDNAQRIAYELTDLLAVADMLCERGLLIGYGDHEQMIAKKEKVRRYLNFSMGRAPHP